MKMDDVASPENSPAREFCGDRSVKAAIHVANRCFDELRRATAFRHSAMPDDTPLSFDLPFVCRKKLTVDFNGGNQSSNGGLLLLREKERALGVAGYLPTRCPIAAMPTASDMRCSKW
jgi:hypothetical protein